MPSLDEFVSTFSRYLETGDKGDLASYCEPGAELDFLSVYRNGYYKSCVDALAANFPTVVSLVGEDYFRTLARAYVDAAPPRLGTLLGYGEDFPDYLSTRHDAHELAYLPDVAKLDQGWLRAYFAEPCKSMGGEDVQLLPGAEKDITALSLQFVASAHTVTLDYAVMETWATLREQGRLLRTNRVEKSFQNTLFWRHRSVVYFRPLPQGEFAFIHGIGQGVPLGDAGEQAQQVDPNFDLAGAFANLIQSGLLAVPELRPRTTGVTL